MIKRILILILLVAPSAFSACHVILPSGAGSKTGADWNNAYDGSASCSGAFCPGGGAGAASWVRGDTYYVADGNYPNWTIDTASGSGTVLITKATSAAHCTATGYNNSTMGSSQAIFTNQAVTNNLGVGFYVRISTVTFDGVSRTALNSGQGIKVDMSVCNFSGEFCEGVAVGDTGNVTNVTFHYLEVEGSGATQFANNNWPDENFAVRNGTTILLDYCYIHDSSGDPVELVSGSSGITIDHCYIYNNASSPPKSCASPCISGNHGEGIAVNGSVSNLTISNSVMQDIEGTAFIDCLNSGAAQTCNNWLIYDDVFYYTSGNPASHGGLGDGIASCVGNGVSGVSCAGWKFYNNTIVNCCTGSANDGLIWNGTPTPTGTPDVKNNIWWSSVSGVNPIIYSGATEDYNSFLGPNDTGHNSGTHDVNTSSTSPTPFVNWTATLGNFNLASDNANWNNRVFLGAPYDTDANGNAFTSSRGAFQFNGSASTGFALTGGIQLTVGAKQQ